MDGSPEEHSPKMQTYLQFDRAGQDGDVEGMRACVDLDRFAIHLPGFGRLTFEEAVQYFESLRGLAHGEQVTYQEKIEQGEKLVVQYYMTFNLPFDGRLIELTSVDVVTFNGSGKITTIKVFYDRADTQIQVFGTTLMPNEDL